MILEPQPGRYRLHGLDSPEAEAVLVEVGVTRADLDHALGDPGAERGHPDPQHHRHQPRRRLRRDAQRLAPRAARCLQGALRPAALAQGPGAARPRSRGQHRPGSSRMAPCRTDRPESSTSRRRGRTSGGDLFAGEASQQLRARRSSTCNASNDSGNARAQPVLNSGGYHGTSDTGCLHVGPDDRCLCTHFARSSDR
jgi:hypothetical protein